MPSIHSKSVHNLFKNPSIHVRVMEQTWRVMDGQHQIYIQGILMGVYIYMVEQLTVHYLHHSFCSFSTILVLSELPTLSKNLKFITNALLFSTPVHDHLLIWHWNFWQHFNFQIVVAHAECGQTCTCNHTLCKKIWAHTSQISRKTVQYIWAVGHVSRFTDVTMNFI